MNKKTKLNIALFGAIAVISALHCHDSYSQVTRAVAKTIYKKLQKVSGVKGPQLVFSTDRKPNAWTSRRYIILSKGAMKLENTAEIAQTLGHELTHWQFRDPYSWIQIGTYQEDRADRYGAVYAERLGYSKCSQAQIYKLYTELYGATIDPSDHHSSNSIRYRRLCHAK
jgi:hypothetical protein